MDVAHGTTVGQRRAWVMGLDPDTCSPVDLLAAVYMNTLFHNLLGNEDTAPPQASGGMSGVDVFLGAVHLSAWAVYAVTRADPAEAGQWHIRAVLR